MHEGTDILNVAAFKPDMGQVRRGVLKMVHSRSWRQLRLKLRNKTIVGLMICFSDFSLWFSLPLSIWLSTGWVGLIFHWRAMARMAARRKLRPVQDVGSTMESPPMTHFLRAEQSNMRNPEKS
jgi:hypothetical protein